LSILLLIVAYFTYGKFSEKLFAPTDDGARPAYNKNDGVGYVPINKHKNALMQLLNIAGTGLIYGSIMDALFAPFAFLWIRMISIRNKGAHIPELAGKFLGNVSKHVVNIFALLLLLLVGTVFVTTPASLLSILLNGKLTVAIIIALIFAYYFLSTILPIDKII